MPYVEMTTAQDEAGLEAVHGDLGTGLALFDTTIGSFLKSGNAADTIGTGAAMELAQAVQYARAQIRLAQRELDRQP